MDSKDRKPKFRQALIESAEKRLGSRFDTLDANGRAKEMARFYIKSIVAKLTPGLVPDTEEEIDEYLVDGPSDGGVDFIYPSEGRVLLVQSKYHSADKYEIAENV